MELQKYQYGVVVANELMIAKGSNKERTALLGQIIRIDSTNTNGSYVIKYLKQGETWESTPFICPNASVQVVVEAAWQFLAAVTSPMYRLRLAMNKSKLEKLLQLTVDNTVFYCDEKDLLLGTIKYIGNVKGIGQCFGIQLHEKKTGTMCDGSCANFQYFHCRPGFGIFSTIDKIQPAYNKPSKKESDLDAFVQKNVCSITGSKQEFENGFKHQSNYFKTSHSMQNILDENTVNTNNDFDQNTVLQPENMYLINRNGKTTGRVKSEVDLIDVIGDWPGGGIDAKRNNDDSRQVKNLNAVSNGISKTVPRKSKLSTERISLKTHPTSKFYVNDLELNERSNDYNTKSVPSTSHHVEKIYHEISPSETNDLTIGSLVEVSNDVSDEPLYGVVRWMGIESGTNVVLVGVELEEESAHLPLTITDGTHNGRRFFECNGDRALFVSIERCHKDSRFQDGLPTPIHSITEKIFEMDCPVIPGAVPPLIMNTEEDVEAVCGKFRGIQGHHNSCYLDATLFAMFTYTAVFDSLLYRPKGDNDISHYEEVQRVLREEIVNPLRKNLFVRADRVMTLRKQLDQLSSVSGLTSEEKDPEEFLNSLLAQILRAEPFLKLNSGQESYYYQLFVEKDDELELPTVQQLFEQSFLTSDIKLKEVPSCLIIQMPRFGKNYKMYPRILPSQLLDVTDIIENSPRQCTVCGKLAMYECKDCFGESSVTSGLEGIAYCMQCLEMAHNHLKRQNHKPKELKVSQEFIMMAANYTPPRLFMELFAVVCIETSHYVAFVKCGVGHEAPWCFFDSMADRKGERNGYNIPEMVACPDVSKWLSDEQICRSLHENAPLDRHLPEHARRLLCDAYICMYQSSDVMMYR